MTTLMQDLRFALRQLRRSPGFAATAVLTLALGIGATTAIFTLTYQVLLRSIPVAHPEQLYKLGKDIDCCVESGMQDDWKIFSYPLYKHLRDSTPGTQGMAAVQAGTITFSAHLADETASQPLNVRLVSGNYFPVLGIAPMHGRLLTPDDDRPGAAPVAVVSHAVWTTKFHSDPGLVGKTVVLTGTAATIVGITGPGFLGERNTGDPAGVWVPLAQEPVLEPTRTLLNFSNSHWLDVLLRVENPKAVPAVQKAVQVELLQWLRANRDPNDNATDADIAKQTTTVTSASSGINDLRAQYEKSLTMLLLIAGAVLLICCANLSNLMLVRAVARSQEIGVRTALGAPRSRLVRQMLVESVVLSLLGGVAGVAVAFAGVRAMLSLAMKGVEVDPLSASPSMPVLLFAFGVSVVTGMLFGTAPAWIASRVDPANALRGANRSMGQASSLPQRVLVILQAALSVVLLSTAGLLISSLRNLEHQDFHFEPHGRMLAFIDLQAAGYRFDQLDGLYRQIDQNFAALPGVQSVAYATYTPMSFNNWGTGVLLAGGDPNKRVYASYSFVSAHFFDTVGTRVLQGRGFNEQDSATSTHVAVINKAFADEYLKGKAAIGAHFGPDRHMTQEREIVGIVDNSKYGDPEKDVRPMFFMPITQSANFQNADGTPAEKDRAQKDEQFAHFASNLVVHYQGDPAAMSATMRRTLNGINPNIPIDKLMTFDEQVSYSFTQQELVVRLTTIFGVLALVLASIGLYGITAYNVAQRVPEIGLRMALGSDRSGILRLILRGALTQTLIGLALGIPAALLAGHALQAKLFGIKSHDVPTLLGACGVLALAALLASAIPAYRASAVDPMQALRAE